MFKTKLVTFNATTTPKLPKTNNVSFDVITIVTLVINSQNNRCLKKGSWLKPKELKIDNKKSVYEVHLLKLSNNYNMVGLINNLLSSMRSYYIVIRLDCLIILL